MSFTRMSLEQHECETHVVPGSAARGQSSPTDTGAINRPVRSGALPSSRGPGTAAS